VESEGHSKDSSPVLLDSVGNFKRKGGKDKKRV
jgi:hypothetical protein